MGPTAKRRFMLAGALLLSCPIAMTLFEHFGEALFPAYREFSKTLISVQAGAASIAPFALWDFLAAALVVAAAIALIMRIVRKRPILPWLSAVVLTLSALFALFVWGWALNHYAPSLADELDLPVREYSVDELADATEHYLREAAELSTSMEREPRGELAPRDFNELAGIAGTSYARLAESRAIFRGSTAPVKALLLVGVPLLYSGHTGIFFSPTGEAGVPLDCAAEELPFIMCHEAAHRLAIASEQEANFAAYLACSSSDDARFRYSGALSAFSYCYSALVRKAPERARELTDALLSENRRGVAFVLADRKAMAEHYRAYEGEFKKVGTAVNNRYLTSFGETAGVQSYGLVVDYLIAWQQRT